MSTKEAFFQIFADAQPAKKSYVSLYVSQPFYGGPEEGGWWGQDDVLVAYQEVLTDEEAEEKAKAVQALADKLTDEAKDSFNRSCAAECEWLEARGLDDDYLPEVSGSDRYWVTTESRPGEHNHEGDRYYS